MNYAHVAYGLFTSRDYAERGIRALTQDGFDSADISLVAQDRVVMQGITPDNETEGTAAGMAIGGTLGLLAGLGALALPGIGPLIAAGPLVTGLVGLGAAGAAGGIAGALIGSGLPDADAKRYSGFINDGQILLTVHCDTPEGAERAGEVLETNGAQNVSTSEVTPTTATRQAI